MQKAGFLINFCKEQIMNYKDLEVWKLAREITIDIHEMSLKLPKFEMFEEGSQIRRSSKSVRTNIVEGYGRRMYKNEYMRFIVFSISSNDETRDHLETLFETKSLTDETFFKKISDKINTLGIKLYYFLKKIETDHLAPK